MGVQVEERRAVHHSPAALQFKWRAVQGRNSTRAVENKGAKVQGQYRTRAVQLQCRLKYKRSAYSPAPLAGCSAGSTPPHHHHHHSPVALLEAPQREEDGESALVRPPPRRAAAAHGGQVRQLVEPVLGSTTAC